MNIKQRYIKKCLADWASSVITGVTSRMKIYFAEGFVGTGVQDGRYNKRQVVAAQDVDTLAAPR